MMIGAEGQPVASANGKITPIMANGVKVISIQFFLPEGQPVVWRGPLVGGAIQQFLRDVEWGDLDYLVVDLPPGTSDAQLTLAQSVPITGAVLVTTPQEVALADVAKALAMFKRVSVPILGLVENMSGFVCAHCGEVTDIFGGRRRTLRGGGRRRLPRRRAARHHGPARRRRRRPGRRPEPAGSGRGRARAHCPGDRREGQHPGRPRTAGPYRLITSEKYARPEPVK